MDIIRFDSWWSDSLIRILLQIPGFVANRQMAEGEELEANPGGK
jgi:hypothetical protein